MRAEIAVPLSGLIGMGIGIAFWFNDTHARLDSIEKRLPPYEIQTQNVVGDQAPETFIEINGQRYFLTIDGNPIDSYRENLSKY